MNYPVCDEKGHRYGIWQTNENMDIAWRHCEKCNYMEQFNILKENTIILEQIKLQKIASERVTNWNSLPDDDITALGGVYAILDNQLCYLGKDDRNILIEKMKKIIFSNAVSMENVDYLNYFISYIQSSDTTDEMTDSFYDKLDEFYDVNRSTFLSFVHGQDGYHESIKRTT